LETGKLELDDLAPRIKDLKGRINEFEGQQRNMLERMREANIELLGRATVKAYVDDLRTLLSKGALMEQKAFLRSFIKRIEVNLPHITLDYTIPLKREKVEPLSREVLPFARLGSPGRTRTSDQLVNSQPLYRLSYRGMRFLHGTAVDYTKFWAFVQHQMTSCNCRTALNASK
jgi:site-specific DNA recombinase